MCYELQYEEIKFDHIFKYTNELILNLNTYGEYLCFCC